MMINIETKRKLCYFLIILPCAWVLIMVDVSTSSIALATSSMFLNSSTDYFSTSAYITSIVSSSLTLINIPILITVPWLLSYYVDSARRKQAEQSAEIERLERILNARPHPEPIIPHRTDNQTPIHPENQDEQERLLTRNLQPND